ncbi:thioredoxin domain-containing protein [Yimella sp. cx-51]|uniref:thioredoxin domain-containing protein n=1 Tax=Yimella sp. cx-51 TaxID=2770551 RepID=UPI00165DAF09|nr:thioredoxin domain-containing protein [Yimella sp. cx-51]MBC9956658.1 thioredoxin domain-containing protein [Yimella sp. cx-51]MBD2759085.1 thioredoxin domain-containing protein [Yimella sp. cx-573]QTH38899.1 thioredoxin domain-containing protein [Yimella sp. cx-51]
MANRLASATSPYLLQHADNPVDWWEWGEEAFNEARRRNVPILLSVGYAACHWCHVMAHESFEDEATAVLMNEKFVNIKVDREERPDIDSIYMNATSAMTGHGGWPMTCVLDHEGLPFFAGTYFPPQPRHGQPSFTQVLQFLSDAWTDRRDDVRGAAEALREHLNREATGGAPISSAEIGRAAQLLAAEFDSRAKGFGGAPKFPPSMVLDFLRLRGTHGDDRSRQMLEETAEAMARGGMYDQLGGGFARYSVDADWVVPHFEKMLYDNAQLLAVYARLGTPLGDRVARETADFLLRELMVDGGALASSLDADTEGVEGKFYAWTPQQLIEVLGPDDAAWAATTFGVTERGTFEHGSSVLQLRQDVDDNERLADVRAKLFAAREQRVRPGRDDKVVAAWNGLAISGLVAAAQALAGDPYLRAAERIADYLLTVHVVEGRLRRVSRDGEVGRPAAVLEDLGCLAGGLLDLAAATNRVDLLDAARALLDDAIERFRAQDGGFYDTAVDAETLIARPREAVDNASPSGLSSVVDALITFTALSGDTRYDEIAGEALASMHEVASRAPRFAGRALVAAHRLATGPEQVAVVGEPGQQRDTLVSAALRRFGGPVAVGDGVHASLPVLAQRSAVAGGAAAFVCRGQVCDLPVTSAERLLGGAHHG